MSTTPLQTITDALIEFILSLLRDPEALEEFEADPEQTLENRGLGNICGDDVRAVAPVIVDRPDVMPRPPAPQPPPPPSQPEPPVVIIKKPPEVVEEINRVTNSFHIDNRSTIVDQSVNQSIWAEGDVMQLFDQEAILAAGDESLAAGDDATVDSSETDTTMGDVAIGNSETTTQIENAFNDESVDLELDAEAEAEDSFNDESVDVDVDSDTEIDDSFNDSTEVEVDVEFQETSPAAAQASEDANAAALAAQPEPVYTEPEPVYTEPEPVYTEPEPQYEDTSSYESAEAEVEEYIEMENDGT